MAAIIPGHCIATVEVILQRHLQATCYESYFLRDIPDIPNYVMYVLHVMYAMYVMGVMGVLTLTDSGVLEYYLAEQCPHVTTASGCSTFPV